MPTSAHRVASYPLHHACRCLLVLARLVFETSPTFRTLGTARLHPRTRVLGHQAHRLHTCICLTALFESRRPLTQAACAAFLSGMAGGQRVPFKRDY